MESFLYFRLCMLYNAQCTCLHALANLEWGWEMNEEKWLKMPTNEYIYIQFKMLKYIHEPNFCYLFCTAMNLLLIRLAFDVWYASIGMCYVCSLFCVIYSTQYTFMFHSTFFAKCFHFARTENCSAHVGLLKFYRHDFHRDAHCLFWFTLQLTKLNDKKLMATFTHLTFVLLYRTYFAVQRYECVYICS